MKFSLKISKSGIENEIKILRDENYDVDEMEEESINFLMKIKYWENHNKDLKVIDIICQL